MTLLLQGTLVLWVHRASSMQAMAKLKEMEGVMSDFFEARSDAAGGGLVVLPGVVALLRALQVSAMTESARHRFRQSLKSGIVGCGLRRPCGAAGVIGELLRALQVGFSTSRNLPSQATPELSIAVVAAAAAWSCQALPKLYARCRCQPQEHF